MDVRTIDLTANQKQRFNIPLRFFMLVAAAGALDVRFLRPNGIELDGEQGRSVGQGYRKWPLNWADEGARWGGYELQSTTTQTVTVAVSMEQGDYNGGQADIVTVTPGATLTPTADVTNIDGTRRVLKAASATRRRIHVKALASNDGVIRVGDVTCTAAIGMQLAAGEGFTFETTAAVYAIRESGVSSQGACIVEELT